MTGIQDIFKLNHGFDDYYFLDEKTFFYPKMEKVNMSEKVLNGRKYNNLYAIEPNEFYLLLIDSTTFSGDNLKRLGLIIDGLVMDDKSYISIYNNTNNIIYITKNIEV